MPPGRQALSATPVACAVVVASKPSNPSRSETASHGNARSRRASHGESNAVLVRTAIARKTQPPIRIMLDASCQPADKRADDLDHFYCNLPFTVKSKDD